jgi:hypothetical protein
MHSTVNSIFYILIWIDSNRISEGLLYIRATNVGFKPMIPVFKWCTKVNALDPAATVIGMV